MFTGNVENSQSDPQQIFQAKKEALFNRGARYASSQPSVNLVSTVIRAVPYVGNMLSSPWYDVFAVRVSFFETALMASVSAVMNFFLALGSTFLALFTVGQVQAFNEAFKRNWLHTALALHATVLGGLGVFSPSLAITGSLVTISAVMWSFCNQILDLDLKMVIASIGSSLLQQLLTFMQNNPKLAKAAPVLQAFIEDVLPKFGDLDGVLASAKASVKAPEVAASAQRFPLN